MSQRLDLTPEGPVARIDRAIALVRAEGIEAVLAAWSAGALPALAVLGGFWLERVEGIHALRPLIAGALVLAFGLRALVLRGICRRYVQRFWPAARFPEGAGRPLAVLRAAFVVALGLSLWGAGFLALSVLGPFGVVALVPLLALRGAIAPSWLVRAACTEEAGGWAWLGAASDNGVQRAEGFVVELLLSLGALGLAANLLFGVAFLLLLLRALLGIDLALLDQFLSFRNAFTLLGASLTALVLLEPLRAALGAIAHVDARVRSEGLDVRAAIDAAIERASRRRAGTGAAHVAALALALGWCGRLAAQEPPVEAEAAAELAAAELAAAELGHDAAVRERAIRTLEGSAYAEFSDARGSSLRQLIERFFEEMLQSSEPDSLEAPSGLTALPLPGAGVFLGAGALFATAIAAYLLSRREPPLAAKEASVSAAPIEDPRARAPRDWLAQATELAAIGRHRDALRAVYLATLVALDRHRALSFDPTRTNWQYLGQLRDAAVRADFRELTRVFDRIWYGHEPADLRDVELCRMLAERMIQRVERARSAA
jgi:hypothetical protein